MESEEVEVSIEDLQKQLESEKKQKEKIATDYKAVEAERNSYRDNLVKTRGAIESNGLGKFDDKWNLNLQNQPKETKEVTVDDKITELKKSYKDGDIESDEYLEKLAEYKAEYIVSKKEKETNEKRVQETVVTSQQKLLQELDNKLPDHNNPQSELFTEMKRIVSTNPSLYDDVDLTSDIKSRARLAYMAYESLAAKGITVNADDKFTTINGGQYSNEGSKGLSESEKNMVLKLGYSQKMLKDLDKKFSNYDNTGGVVFMES